MLDIPNDLLPEHYLKLATESFASIRSLFSQLLLNRKIPSTPWPKNAIHLFLNEISLLDCNNFVGNSGLGEREGRCLSSIVYDRHFGLIHGMGRSGDLLAEQPKAVGSTLIVKLAHYLLKDFLQNICNIRVNRKDLVILPVATGMSLSLCFLALMRETSKRTVLFSRIDQKSCIKSMTSLGLKVIVIEQTSWHETDIARFESDIARFKDDILCIFATTSCFAPRQPDNILKLGELAKERSIPLIINNAYGLQCKKICSQLSHIQSNPEKYRFDAVVQSLDKNFMVPVGGAVLFGRLASLVSDSYPGRASIGGILDLLVTFLETGLSGFRTIFDDREKLFVQTKQKIWDFCKDYNTQLVGQNTDKKLLLLDTPLNRISFSLALEDFDAPEAALIGRNLYFRRVTGPRVVCTGEKRTIDRLIFENFGSHSDSKEFKAYLTVAVALGCSLEEVEIFLDRFRKLLKF
jgi:O-phospho-L-seryl-tRNASec:L-selenocysteinyl-tRNA synthase